jgi:undecaprenyl-diphosphatase
MDQHEYQLCLLFNRYTTVKMVRAFFAVISRLGNGVFWYGLILGLPFIYGLQAITTSIMMIVSGTIGIILYKLLKNNLVRQRPCIHHAAIQQGTAMLDLYSFPSGHTLHAFSFGIIVLHTYPQLSIIIAPFMLLVAASRVVLGLHYPSDVIVGALIGTSLATITISATL